MKELVTFHACACLEESLVLCGRCYSVGRRKRMKKIFPVYAVDGGRNWTCYVKKIQA